MEPKKYPQVDLRNKRPLFFNIGLAVSLLLTLLAFEYHSPVNNFALNWEAPHDIFDEPPMPITEITPPPPKPKVIHPTIIEVEDNIEPDDIEVDLDIEMTEEEEIEFLTSEEPEEEIIPDVFFVAESMPSYPGGLKAFYKFYKKKMRYPAKARSLGIEGRVTLSFIIDTDGSLTDIKVLKGIGAGCDEEAIRVLKKMPKWNPGKQRGKAVKVQMSIPINFQLN